MYSDLQRRIFQAGMFIILSMLFLFGSLPAQANSYSLPPSDSTHPGTIGGNARVYLPLIQTIHNSQPSVVAVNGPQVNAPYFAGDVRYAETGLFWFGQVTPNNTYTDVRVGYNDSELFVNLAIVDRRLWYNPQPVASDLTRWDAVSLYLDLDGNPEKTTGSRAYRLVGAAFPSGGSYDSDPNYRAAYQGNGSGWSQTGASFDAFVGWRGDGGFNVAVDEKGWAITYHIPFKSLGFSSKPADGSLWRLAVTVHNRNESGSASITSTSWPSGMSDANPSTWGWLRFGTPFYNPPAVSPQGSITIRDGLNGAHVLDGEVGGDTTCGQGLDYWTQWGTRSQPGNTNNADFNIQNESDISDWPCFARVYLTFPLDQIPAGKTILSAKLVLHEMGSSGGVNWNPPAGPSYIQVFRVDQDWNENTLSWNNGPQSMENVSGAWIDPTGFPGWPGIAWIWDASRVVADTYGKQPVLRLALYSSDNLYHSGKYFVSSHTGDWNAIARPSLEVTWGQP